MTRMTDERWSALNNMPRDWTAREQAEVALELSRRRAREARLEAALRAMLDAFPAAFGSPEEHEARATAQRELEAE